MPDGRRLPSPGDLEIVFHMALRAGDAKGVEAALKVLAVQDPARAQMLFDLLKTAVHIAQASNGDANA
jgi:hypothetical protein